MTVVRFTVDDPGALWRAGDEADDLGWECGEEELPYDAPPIRLLRLHITGETLALTDPYGRGLIEALP